MGIKRGMLVGMRVGMLGGSDQVLTFTADAASLRHGQALFPGLFLVRAHHLLLPGRGRRVESTKTLGALPRQHRVWQGLVRLRRERVLFHRRRIAKVWARAWRTEIVDLFSCHGEATLVHYVYLGDEEKIESEKKRTKMTSPRLSLQPSSVVLASLVAEISLPSPAAASDVWLLPAPFTTRRCDAGGIPVTGSSLAFNVAMLHDGVMRRSEDEFCDEITIDTSGMVCNDMIVCV